MAKKMPEDPVLLEEKITMQVSQPEFLKKMLFSNKETKHSVQARKRYYEYLQLPG